MLIKFKFGRKFEIYTKRNRFYENIFMQMLLWIKKQNPFGKEFEIGNIK